MPNPENIEKHKFTTENQPAVVSKSRKGIPNRATVFKNLLNIKINVPDPTNSRTEKKKISMYEAAALGQIKSAMKGNTAAWKEIQDSLHGKVLDQVEHSNPDGTALAQPIADALNQFERTLLKVYGRDDANAED